MYLGWFLEAAFLAVGTTICIPDPYLKMAQARVTSSGTTLGAPITAASRSRVASCRIAPAFAKYSAMD